MKEMQLKILTCVYKCVFQCVSISLNAREVLFLGSDDVNDIVGIKCAAGVGAIT